MPTIWDVWWADVMFDEGGRSKVRPVLIMNNAGNAYVLALKMTSQQPADETDFLLKHWQIAGLPKPTTVLVLRLLKLQPTQLLNRIGCLHPSDISDIKTLIRSVYKR